MALYRAIIYYRSRGRDILGGNTTGLGMKKSASVMKYCDCTQCDMLHTNIFCILHTYHCCTIGGGFWGVYMNGKKVYDSISSHISSLNLLYFNPNSHYVTIIFVMIDYGDSAK